MSSFVPVTLEAFGHKRWKRFTNYSFAASQAVVPLVNDELTRAAISMPIGLVPHEGSYRPAAILGLTPGQSLYVGPDGRWLGHYIPASLRSYPFAISRTDSGEEFLCIAENSGLVVDPPEGEPFFESSGKPTGAVKAVFSFLQQISAAERRTRELCETISSLDIIRPWSITVQESAAQRQLTGMFRFDEAALDGLSDQTFIQIRALRAFPLIYCQLLSMQHLAQLGPLQSLRTEAVRLQVSAAATGELDLEFLNSDPSIAFRFQ